MPLETPTYIQDLIATNPAGTDPKGQGDDHIRNLKAAIRNTFPTANRAFQLKTWSEKEAGFTTQAADRNQVADDNGKLHYFDATTAARTYNLLPVATAGAGFVCWVARSDDSATNWWALTLDGNGTETINGAATLVLAPGDIALLYCTGAEWFAFLSPRKRDVIKTEVFTASGSWTRKAGIKKIRVTVVGGGGAGGGAGATAAGQSSAGGGGGGGGTSIKVIDGASLAATETVTIGAGGTGVAGATGNTGGTSSFGAHCSATGGAGGSTGGASAISGPSGNGGVGGVGSSGDSNFVGSGGLPGFRNVSNVGLLGASGSSFVGGGQAGTTSGAPANGSAAAANSGGGGMGSLNVDASGARSGGAGGSGLVIVEEFY